MCFSPGETERLLVDHMQLQGRSAQSPNVSFTDGRNKGCLTYTLANPLVHNLCKWDAKSPNGNSVGDLSGSILPEFTR